MGEPTPHPIVQVLAERGVSKQGLDLEVRDPAALHRIAVLILGTTTRAGSPEQAA